MYQNDDGTHRRSTSIMCPANGSWVCFKLQRRVFHSHFTVARFAYGLTPEVASESFRQRQIFYIAYVKFKTASIVPLPWEKMAPFCNGKVWKSIPFPQDVELIQNLHLPNTVSIWSVANCSSYADVPLLILGCSSGDLVFLSSIGNKIELHAPKGFDHEAMTIYEYSDLMLRRGLIFAAS